jgi:hypothetical protein
MRDDALMLPGGKECDGDGTLVLITEFLFRRAIFASTERVMALYERLGRGRVGLTSKTAIQNGRKKQNVETYPFALLNLRRISFNTICPKLIIIGGFCSIDWSLNTGRAKTEGYQA